MASKEVTLSWSILIPDEIQCLNINHYAAKERLLQLFCSYRMTSFRSLIRIALPAILAVSAYWQFQRPAVANDESCFQAMETVYNSILGHGGYIFSAEEKSIGQDRPSPYREEGEIFIILGDPRIAPLDDYRTKDLMMSPQLLRGFADAMIKACSGIVRVSFATRNSSWIDSYSWINNSFTSRDECIDHIGRATPEAKWGQQICW